MTRERLELLTLDELKIIARNYRLEECDDRELLITQLLDFFAEARQEREEGHNLLVLGEARKYSVCRDEEIDPQIEDENEIPSTYNETRIVALVRSPQWAFVYWDTQRARLKATMSAKGLRRVVLRVSCVEEESSFDIPLKETDEHRYIHLPRPGCAYVMELVGKNTSKEHVLARSNVIRTPCGAATAIGRMSDDPILKLCAASGSEAASASLEVPYRVSSD